MLSSLLNTRLSRKESGFTLIELLIVVIVIGVLAAIALPLFINQQRIAVDASVKSDVRNTVANLNNWLVDHRGVEVADTAAYTSSANGGKVAKSRPNTVIGVRVLADGNYGVCAFNEGGNDYKVAEKAWAFDSAAGKFAMTLNGRCDGAVDADGNDLSVTPVAPALTASSLSLPDATQDTAYTTTLVATGTPNPTFKAATSGANSLPAGLTLSSGGKLSGQAVDAGTFSIAVTVKNIAGEKTQNVALKVLSKDAAPEFTSSDTAPSSDYNASGYSYTVTTTGYPTPVLSVANGSSLPAGLNFDATTGKITGKPTAEGSFTTKFTATNRAGTKTQDVNFTINRPVAITAGSLPTTGSENAVYSYTVTATGFPAPKFTATNLPTGLSIDSTSGKVGSIPTVPGTYSNVVVTATQVTDGVTKTVSTSPVSITIKPSAVSSGLEDTETAQNALWAYGAGASRVKQLARTGEWSVLLQNAYNSSVSPTATYNAKTVVGQTYKLSVYITSSNTNPTTVSVAGQSQAQGNFYSNARGFYRSGYTEKVFTFTATSTTTPVTFTNTYDFYSPSGASVDDLVLTPQ